MRSGRCPTRRFVPTLHRDRPLGVLAQRQARHAEDRRLLLDAARVGQHDARVRHQLQEVEVAERLDEPQPRHAPRRAPRGRGPRASGACAGAPGRRPAGPLARPPARRGASPSTAGSSTFDGPVQRQHGVAAAASGRRLVEDARRLGRARGAAAACRSSRCRRGGSSSAGDALAAQVLDAALLGAEEQVADRVGEHAVDLLGHRRGRSCAGRPRRGRAGTPSFTATSPQAIVLFTSPTTSDGVGPVLAARPARTPS